jgi:hypothetical protein
MTKKYDMFSAERFHFQRSLGSLATDLINLEKGKNLLGLSGSMAICSKHVQRQEINEKIQASTLSYQPLFHLYPRGYDTSGQPLPFLY